MSFIDGSSQTMVNFDSYSIVLPLQFRSVAATSKRSELGTFELLNAAKGMQSYPQVKYRLEFHRRFTFPILCLVLMIVAPPLSLMTGASGRMGGLSLGFLVVGAYYAFQLFVEGIIRAGLVPHFPGAWVPCVASLCLAITIFRKEAAR